MKPWRGYKNKFKKYVAYAKQNTIRLAAAIWILGKQVTGAAFALRRRIWNGLWFKGEQPETRFSGWVAAPRFWCCA